jgi:hypothetical protein
MHLLRDVPTRLPGSLGSPEHLEDPTLEREAIKAIDDWVAAGILRGVCTGSLALRSEALLATAQAALRDGFGFPVWAHCFCRRLSHWQGIIKRFPDLNERHPNRTLNSRPS